MTIKNAQFTLSSPTVAKCPKDNKPEFAFIGRSNVGKSSLINMLCQRKSLAKTSATPGKTLLINHFHIQSLTPGPSPKGEGSIKGEGSKRSPSPSGEGRGEAREGRGEASWYLVDLPGYGFAKRSKSVQKQLEQMISGYILQREQLVNVFVLIDVRLEQQLIDREFIDWLGMSGVPFSIVFTKADKVGLPKAKANAEAWMHKLEDTWEELPPYFITSSEKSLGRDELLSYIERYL